VHEHVHEHESTLQVITVAYGLTLFNHLAFMNAPLCQVCAMISP
jgi:hypothetical protein